MERKNLISPSICFADIFICNIYVVALLDYWLNHWVGLLSLSDYDSGIESRSF